MPARVRNRNVVLAMLLLVYTFNFLDRQILGMLVQPIKADLHLTDTQLGALGGIAFAVLYALLGVPLAMVADRTSRSWVIAISLRRYGACVHRAVRDRHRLRHAVRASESAVGRRRGGRGGAVLCADRRLFPAPQALEARWRSTRWVCPSGWRRALCSVAISRRWCRGASPSSTVRAGGYRHHAAVQMGGYATCRESAAPMAGADGRGREGADRRGVRHPRAQAELLADGVCRLVRARWSAMGSPSGCLPS